MTMATAAEARTMPTPVTMVVVTATVMGPEDNDYIPDDQAEHAEYNKNDTMAVVVIVVVVVVVVIRVHA